MQLLLKIADRSEVWDRLITDATQPGDKCHAEVRFADGRCFSSMQPHGVRFVESIDTSNIKQWEVLDLPWVETLPVVDWCESQVGCKYNFQGAFLSALGRAHPRAGYWFCSEIVAEVLKRVGMPSLGILPHPNQLEMLVKATLGIKQHLCFSAVSVATAGDFFELAARLDAEQSAAADAPLTIRASSWATFRKHVLAENRSCVVCGRPATIVHHVKPVHLYPSLELDPSNCRPICCEEEHRILGHLLNYHSWNPKFDEDAARFRDSVRTRP
jgi:hypothetical protein